MRHLVPLIRSDCTLDVLQQPPQLCSAAPASECACNSCKDACGVLGAEGMQRAEAQIKTPRQQLHSDCQPAHAHDMVSQAWFCWQRYLSVSEHRSNCYPGCHNAPSLLGTGQPAAHGVLIQEALPRAQLWHGSMGESRQTQAQHCEAIRICSRCDVLIDGGLQLSQHDALREVGLVQSTAAGSSACLRGTSCDW